MTEQKPIYNVQTPPTPGIHTSEFWLTAVSNIIGAILAILSAYGLIAHEAETLWLTLAQAIGVAVIPIALAIINQSYINGRVNIKIQEIESSQFR